MLGQTPLIDALADSEKDQAPVSNSSILQKSSQDEQKFMVFQENFKFEKNKLIYYQTVKSNLRSLFLKGQFSLLEIFDAPNYNLSATIQKIS